MLKEWYVNIRKESLQKGMVMRINKFILLILIYLLSSYGFADTKAYMFDPLHSSVSWRISHFGYSHPSGKWMVESGVIRFDEAKLSEARISATINIEDIDTGIPKLDQELIGQQFFDAAQYPTASFVSTNIRVKSANKFTVKGNLTLHGVTRAITLDAQINKIGIHPVTLHQTIGISANCKIRRSDFGIKAYLPGLSDEVDLAIEAEASVVPAQVAR